MADQVQYYDAQGRPIIDSQAPAVPPPTPPQYFDAHGNPLLLPSSAPQLSGQSVAAPPNQQQTEDVVAPYLGRLAANSLPMAGSFLGPEGTGAGIVANQVLRHLSPSIFGEPPEGISGHLGSAAGDLLSNEVLPRAVSGAIGAVTNPASKLLRNFPAVRDAIVGRLSQQGMREFAGQDVSRVLEQGAADASQNYFPQGGADFQPIRVNPVTADYQPIKIQGKTADYQPINISKTSAEYQPIKIIAREASYQPITEQSGSSFTPKMGAAGPPKDVPIPGGTQTVASGPMKQAEGDSFSVTPSGPVKQVRAGGTETVLTGPMRQVNSGSYYVTPAGNLRSGQVSGGNPIGDMFLQLHQDLKNGVDVVQSQSYKKIADASLSDLSSVRNAKLATGSGEFVEQLALNKLLTQNFSETEGKLNTKGILDALSDKSLKGEVYREAISPQTQASLGKLANEIESQVKGHEISDRVVSWSQGHLVWAAANPLHMGTSMLMGPGMAAAGITLTNSQLARVMSNPATADLVIRAMRTPASAPEAGLITKALAHVLQGGADLATVPEK